MYRRNKIVPASSAHSDEIFPYCLDMPNNNKAGKNGHGVKSCMFDSLFSWSFFLLNMSADPPDDILRDRLQQAVNIGLTAAQRLTVLHNEHGLNIK